MAAVGRRQPNLGLNQIDTGDHFSNRMLNLDARVDFYKVKVVLLIDNKLDCAGVVILGSLDQTHGGFANPVRVVAGKRGDGLSSINFWWRRCTEQSRSNK